MLKARVNCQDQVPDNHTQRAANQANNSSPTDLANPCTARTQQGIIRCSSRRFTPRFASRGSQTRTPKAKKFNARFFATRLPFSTLYTCLCTPDIVTLPPSVILTLSSPVPSKRHGVIVTSFQVYLTGRRRTRLPFFFLSSPLSFSSRKASPKTLAQNSGYPLSNIDSQTI